MRAIKFRARRIDTGAWVYGDSFTTPLTDENSGTTPDAGWYFLTGERRHCISSDGVAFVVDEQTLGQWTGLLDQEGQEVYEGDIVRDASFDVLFEVCWGNGKREHLGNQVGWWLDDARFSAVGHLEELTAYLGSRESREEYFRGVVVGNIWEPAKEQEP